MSITLLILTSQLELESQGLGECLDNAPKPLMNNYTETQPGILYNAQKQCRLQFNVTDSDVGTCSSMNEICSTLWCKVNGECITNMRPTAPGTRCGEDKVCIVYQGYSLLFF